MNPHGDRLPPQPMIRPVQPDIDLRLGDHRFNFRVGAVIRRDRTVLTCIFPGSTGYELPHATSLGRTPTSGMTPHIEHLPGPRLSGASTDHFPGFIRLTRALRSAIRLAQEASDELWLPCRAGKPVRRGNTWNKLAAFRDAPVNNSTRRLGRS